MKCIYSQTKSIHYCVLKLYKDCKTVTFGAMVLLALVQQSTTDDKIDATFVLHADIFC